MNTLLRARQKAESAAIHDPHHDALTLLPNRRLMQDRLTVALSTAERQNSQFAVLSLDLDGFRQVNDQFGHDVGDALLVEVAGRLKRLVRAQDTVARMGGDEFIVTLSALRDVAEVHSVVQRIIETVSAPYICSARQLSIGTSVGVALYPRDGRNERELLKVADNRLYAAKASRATGAHRA